MNRKTTQAGPAADAGAFYVPGQFSPDQSVGYLMRNVIDIPLALQEQMRVLKPGGRIVIKGKARRMAKSLWFARFGTPFNTPPEWAA